MTFIQLLEQIRQFPRMIANAVKQRQQRIVLDEREAERLDRIRNPSKYQGR